MNLNFTFFESKQRRNVKKSLWDRKKRSWNIELIFNDNIFSLDHIFPWNTELTVSGGGWRSGEFSFQWDWFMFVQSQREWKSHFHFFFIAPLVTFLFLVFLFFFFPPQVFLHPTEPNRTTVSLCSLSCYLFFSFVNIWNSNQSWVSQSFSQSWG